MKKIIHNALVSVAIILASSFSLTAQQFVSLDPYTKINSIKIVVPTGSYWNNPSDFSILLIDVNTNLEQVGGSKDNPAKHAVLFSKEQLKEVSAKVKATGTYFIGKIPSYHTFYLPTLQKEASILENVNGALFVHRISLQKHPDTTPYEYCDSRNCPDSISHEIISSFQITKSGDKYYLVTGMPMNNGGTPIPWDIKELKKTGGMGEVIIELTTAQYNSLFN